LSEGNADAVDSSQVNTANPDQRSAQVVVVTGRILGVRTVLFLREYIGAVIRPIGTDKRIGVFDFNIASLDLSGLEIIKFQSLL
jgi:hypothetical protein